MTGEKLQTKLYQRMTAEQEQYRNWLLGQPPDEILRHASEYTVRADVLYALDGSELTNGQLKALLKSSRPLADIFDAWQNWDSQYIYDLRDAMADHADAVIRAEKEKGQREGR